MSVIVHTCYSIDLYEPKPPVCACRREVTAKQAWDLVLSGEADWVIMYDRPKPYCTSKQVCLTNKKKATPRGATIEKAHMERAYVMGDLEEKERIKAYGLLNYDFFAKLVRFYDDAEHRAAERKYRGREYSIVDGGDLIKPLPEKIDDQNQLAVEGRSSEGSLDPKVPGDVSGPVIFGKKS